MTKKEKERLKLEQQVKNIVGSKTLPLSQIAGRFRQKDRDRVARFIVPFLEHEGYLVRTYDGGPETCFRAAVR